MKNLSLLLLALVASPVEAASFAQATSGKRTKAKPVEKTPSPSQGSSNPFARVAAGDDFTDTQHSHVVTSQPRRTIVVEEAPFSKKLATLQVDNPASPIVIKSHQEWNESKADKRQRRFEDTDDISGALQKLPNPVALKDEKGKFFSPLATKIRHTKGLILEQSKKELDEEARLKKSFAPVILALRSPKLEVRKRSEKKIVGTEEINRDQLFKDDASAVETASGSTHAIYGADGEPRLSFLEIMPNIYTPEARAAKPLAELFEAARLCELKISLLELEEFPSLSTVETDACQRLTALQAEKKQVLSSSTEINRIESERALARIQRAITGTEAQYKTIQDDRERKRTLIAQLRDQIGAQVAGVGLLRWAAGKTDASRPTLQAVFHNTKAAELELQKGKLKVFLDYLKTLPTPKIKPLKLPLGISAILKDPKERSLRFILDMPENAGRYDKKNNPLKTEDIVVLSVEEDRRLGSIFLPSYYLPTGSSGEEAVRVDKYEIPEHIKNAPTLVALYTERVNAVPKPTPTLEELHEKRNTRPHWAAKGFDDRTLEWEQVVPSTPAAAAASSELAAV